MWQLIALSIAISIQGSSFSFAVRKSALIFAPALPSFTRVHSATIDGKPATLKIEESSQDVHVALGARIDKKIEIEIKFSTGIEIDIPIQEIEIGQRAPGLKCLGVEKGADQLKLVIEGAAGHCYRMRVRSALGNLKIDGAKVVGDSSGWNEIEASFPDSATEAYIRKTIEISVQKSNTKAPRH